MIQPSNFMFSCIARPYMDWDTDEYSETLLHSEKNGTKTVPQGYYLIVRKTVPLGVLFRYRFFLNAINGGGNIGNNFFS